MINLSQMTINELISEMEIEDKSKGLSDGYLAELGKTTRTERGIGEYEYGIVSIPVDFVLPHLKQVEQLQAENQKLREALEEIEKLSKDYEIFDIQRNILKDIINQALKESEK